MSDSTPSRPSADRNLLFGILALQMEFISRDALIAAMHTWVLDKVKPLGQILREQHALGREEQSLLDALVGKHLEKHSDDPGKSLAAVPVPRNLRAELHGIADHDLEASLSLVIPDTPTPTNTIDYTPLPSEPGGARYRIVRPHAKGGLGEVFVALDQELQREVALKEIDADHAHDAYCRGRFVQEAQITGGLEHPGIVPVYGLGQYADGRPFYAMRFIHGETLKEAARHFHETKEKSGEHWLTLRQLLSRFVAVCNTVAYAHSRGVLHRDLKPANIMLGKYGETLVVDWGLAKAVGHVEATAQNEEATLRPASAQGLTATQVGAALGTPPYMSPEQAAGQVEHLGPASDIYSLGATLYTLLTGQPPIQGTDTGEILQKVKQGDWKPPRMLKREIPHALDAICRKAMARIPVDRYPTALALAADIEHWLGGEPVSAWPEPWSVRTRRKLARHRTLATSAVVAVLVAIVGLSLGLALLAAANERERDARQNAEAKEEEALHERGVAKEQRDEARMNWYVSQIRLAERDWEVASINHMREVLGGNFLRDDGSDMRGFEWHYLQRLCHADRQISMSGRLLALSPDRTLLATDHAPRDPSIRLWDLATFKPLTPIFRHAFPVTSAAISNDNKRLAVAGGQWNKGECHLWDIASTRQVYALKGLLSQVDHVAFSPDGKYLATSDRDPFTEIKIWDAITGARLQTLGSPMRTIHALIFCPDGRRLVAAGGDELREQNKPGEVRMWEVATGKPQLAFRGHAGRVLGVAFSPDGKRLATGSEDQTIKVWNAITGNQLFTLKGHGSWVRHVAFSPDGKRLASAGGDPQQPGAVLVWDLEREKLLRKLKGHSGPAMSLAFNSSGRQLISVNSYELFKIWDIATEAHFLEGHKRSVNCAMFSPDGKSLASAGDDRVVRIWEVATGQEVRRLPGHISAILSLAFSPDGQLLVSAGHDATVRLWDVASGKQVRSLSGHSAWVTSVAFRPDGRQIASASWDGTVRIWDAKTGVSLHSLNTGSKGPGTVAYSSDSQRLALSAQGVPMRIWDAGTGQEVQAWIEPRRGRNTLAFSPDGRRIAIAGGQELAIFDSSTVQRLLVLKGHTGEVTSVAFSPDGLSVASAGRDLTLKVWHAVSGQELLTLSGHTKPIHTIAFSPDSRRLVSAGDDETVRIWDGTPVQ